MRNGRSQFSAISMVFPQILVDFQSISIDFLSFSISSSQLQSILISFNQFQSVSLGQKRRNWLTTGRWGKTRKKSRTFPCEEQSKEIQKGKERKIREERNKRAEKKKAYTTTTERKSLGEPFWPQKINFPGWWWVQKPYENQENHIYHRNLSSVAPIFFGKEKFCTGAGRCMLSFSQESTPPRLDSLERKPWPPEKAYQAGGRYWRAFLCTLCTKNPRTGLLRTFWERAF